MSGKEGYCEYFGLSDSLDGDISALVCREYSLPVPFPKTTTKLPFCTKMWINGTQYESRLRNKFCRLRHYVDKRTI